MDFLPADLIRKKRFGGAHARAEIHFLVQGLVRGEIADSQIAAWLMAICFQGMSAEETAWLTEEMRDSGVVLNLSALGASVDKHSTGGVGDKTSLIVAPLVAAAGVPVPMIAGRGLAHTGGTLDKLEAISGLSVNLSLSRFQNQIASIGTAIMGQTSEICPADRKLYALRDVTGTVDSLPLICGSIMSKKLAEGISGLVLDVKFGSGAFMKSASASENLALALMDIGRRAGKRVTALLTRMDEPLGRFVGNALEVQECLDILDGKVFRGEGKGWADTLELALELSAHMVFLGGKSLSVEAARPLVAQRLRDGSAKEKFVQMVEAQGGDLSQPLPMVKPIAVVRAESSGFMQYLDVEKIGIACIHLGAGRKFQGDDLDLGAGLEVFRHQGDAVRAGDPLFTIFARSASHAAAALPGLQASYTVSPQATPQSPLIAKVLL